MLAVVCFSCCRGVCCSPTAEAGGGRGGGKEEGEQKGHAMIEEMEADFASQAPIEMPTTDRDRDRVER